MKLNVVFVDTHSPYCTAMVTGIVTAPNRRYVTIELLGEQAAQLEKRIVGEACGKTVKEEIQSCWLDYPETK